MNAVAHMLFSRRGVFHATPFRDSRESGHFFAAARQVRGGPMQSRQMTR